jgi:RNA polymerase sigma factor (sigma-70 family)
MADAAGDDGLWERCRAGDAGARERLAELARACALAELVRRRAPREAVADLAQEVVRSTLAFLARGGAAPRELPAFLKYRTWGVLSDHRKRMRTTLPLADAAAAPERKAPEATPERSAHRLQLARALADCRQRLAGEQRETLELRYEGQLDSQAIADQLGLHRNTVHVRVFRALAALRECLGRKGFAAEDLEP